MKPDLYRRRLLAGALALTGGLAASPLAAAGLTPRQSAGPFYPRQKPLDSDNDLTRVEGRGEPAHGTPLELTGQVLAPTGRPMTGAMVEIWQTNGYGRYHHPGDRRDAPLDPNFQGYGHDLTDAAGRYRFRTVEPLAYPASASWMRPAHIHVAVSGPGFERFVTQMYFAGDPHNAKDGLLNAIRDPAERDRLIVAFAPAPPEFGPDTKLGHFEIVLGSRG